MTLKIHKFANNEALVAQLTQQVSDILTTAVQERGHGYLVVSGGRTPVSFFQQLAQQPLPWQNISILLADERWLPVSHEASNEGLVRQYLLQHHAKAAEMISLISEHSTAVAGLRTINQRLQPLPRFDAVILGMGEDGHTASLFPESAALQEGLSTQNPAVAVTPLHAPHERMSLSKSRLLNSQHLFFHLVGKAKAAVLEQALAENSALPASVFLQQDQVPVEVLLAAPEE
ncbi:6-phosphogluconolactonase [Aliidiomarina iranensis]|uniref:6-phosphogluconolactonase n=1 Tax=Aliidiomarina iranensis TaxID=1434071 RepID=A0A432VWJ8_9GAMM|nr:6-phosphogluconolactonase [Aliidiomarina iranensis]RUO20874.1 6-phosphogluconolactonase [Aliidiomarina iranensis]